MDTNSKQFQALLQNLTNSYVQFLEAVSPVGVGRELIIQHIAQSLQNLSLQFDSLNGKQASEFQSPKLEIMKPSDTSMDSTTIVETVTEDFNKNIPTTPNYFREKPDVNKNGVWFFDRVRPNDNPDKYFQLYTDGDEGEFEMKPISQDRWPYIFMNKDFLLNGNVVKVIEGQIVPNAESQSIGRGKIHFENIDGRMKWVIKSPCTILIKSIIN